jgi:hypothetical protein
LVLVTKATIRNIFEIGNCLTPTALKMALFDEKIATFVLQNARKQVDIRFFATNYSGLGKN